MSTREEPRCVIIEHSADDVVSVAGIASIYNTVCQILKDPVMPHGSQKMLLEQARNARIQRNSRFAQLFNSISMPEDPVLLVVSNAMSRPDIESAVKDAFESSKVVSLAVVQSHVAASLAVAQTSSLVIEVSPSLIDASCVIDSKIISSQSARYNGTIAEFRTCIGILVEAVLKMVDPPKMRESMLAAIVLVPSCAYIATTEHSLETAIEIPEKEYEELQNAVMQGLQLRGLISGEFDFAQTNEFTRFLIFQNHHNLTVKQEIKKQEDLATVIVSNALEDGITKNTENIVGESLFRVEKDDEIEEIQAPDYLRKPEVGRFNRPKQFGGRSRALYANHKSSISVKFDATIFKDIPTYIEAYKGKMHMAIQLGASLLARIIFSDTKQYITAEEYAAQGPSIIHRKNGEGFIPSGN